MLRVVAMLYIAVILHYLPAYTERSHIVYAFGNAFEFVGVGTFFALSGFLFGYQDKKGKQVWKGNLSWLRKRAIRIFPGYEIVVLTVIFFRFSLDIPVTVLDSTVQLLNLHGIFLLGYGFGAEMGHTWFLSVLMFCYLLTPLLRKLQNRREMALVAAIAVLLLTGLSFLPVYTFASYAASIVLYIAMYYIGCKTDIWELSEHIWICGTILVSMILLHGAAWYFSDDTPLTI